MVEDPIRVTGVYHSFEGREGQVDALEQIDMVVRPGELVAVVGPSGCGKTTLLNLVCGLEPLQRGAITVEGRSPHPGTSGVGYIFARDAILPWRSAIRNVELGMLEAGVDAPERTQRARHWLAEVGLSGFEGAYRSELSQGMRQRVALARTLALEPRIILMDEPFSALDAQTKILVQDTFVSLRQRIGGAGLLITHDVTEAVALADRVVVMTRRPGRIKQTIEVDLPQPRSVVSLQGDRSFHEQCDQVWKYLREEVNEFPDAAPN